MPLFYFRCGGAEIHEVRRLLPKYDPTVALSCPTCGSPLARAPRPPTANVVETLDNNWMVRRVERPADVERLIAERNDKAGKDD